MPTSLRIPKGLLDRIDAAAKESGYSRTEAILQFVRWALDEHERERAEKRKK